MCGVIPNWYVENPCTRESNLKWQFSFNISLTWVWLFSLACYRLSVFRIVCRDDPLIIFQKIVIIEWFHSINGSWTPFVKYFYCIFFTFCIEQRGWSHHNLQPGCVWRTPWSNARQRNSAFEETKTVFRLVLQWKIPPNLSVNVTHSETQKVVSHSTYHIDRVVKSGIKTE